MKKAIFSLLLAAIIAPAAHAQDYVMIHLNDGQVGLANVNDISKLTFATTEAVDLGLSVKWATCNVGANAPEESGLYFAWGELTANKESWVKTTYEYYDEATGEYEDLGTDITGTEYDIAHEAMGGDWRMPTKDEWDELMNNCTWTSSTLNGVSGNTVTAANGNSIFIPLAGYYSNSTLQAKGDNGAYWSSTASDTAGSPYSADLWPSFPDWSYYSFAHVGQTVRAVCGPLPDGGE